MFIDTHCHINMMIKKKFDVLLESEQINQAQSIIDEAQQSGVTTIINVGTSLPESLNCVEIAKKYDSAFATVGIHPNDCTESWQSELNTLASLLNDKTEHKIVGIGECGIDMHYPDYNLHRQQDAFKAQIELALKYDLALVVHSRDAADETLTIIEEYKNDITRATMHCFSYDQAIANQIIEWGFVIGIDGPVTYPKNHTLQNIVINTDLKHMVLETDAPFLPPQEIRGKQNHPKYIRTIAEFIAQLRGESLEHVAQQTSNAARKLFNIL